MRENLLQEQVIPFDTSKAYRFVPWVIALMVFLAILALAGSAMVSSIVGNWQQSDKKQIVIALPTSSLSPTIIQDHRQRVLEVLKNLRSVDKVSIVEKQKISLITGELPEGPITPSSLSFEVTMQPGQNLHRQALQWRLQQEVAGAVLEDDDAHELLMVQLSRSIFWISSLLSLLIGIAAIVTITFVTHTGLETHQRVINICHIVGAHNDFIARQFQRHAMVLACKGGIIGTVLSFIACGVIAALLPSSNLLGIPTVMPYGMIGAIMVLTPLGVMILAAVSAHCTVLATLTHPKGGKVS